MYVRVLRMWLYFVAARQSRVLSEHVVSRWNGAWCIIANAERFPAPGVTCVCSK